MYTIYFFAALAFIITIVVMYENNEIDFSEPDTYGIPIGSLLFGFLVGLLACLLWTISTMDKPENLTHETKTYEIVCLQDNSRINGNFFLGCGSVDGKMKYTLYYKDNNNDIRGEELPFDNVILKYTKDKPKFEISYDVLKKSNYRLWNGLRSNTKYRIYIPEGTIVNNYNLDAK